MSRLKTLSNKSQLDLMMLVGDACRYDIPRSDVVMRILRDLQYEYACPSGLN